MARRMLAGILTAFVLGGFGWAVRETTAQVADPGTIVIIGVNLSGQWDFDMTVLGASDPAMIGRTFTGSFTVSGGVPTYTGDGTFNGLPATISGNGAVDPADGVTIVLSDHIATTDSTTTFTATLMSGDFGTGTFEGGTLDGTQTWEGVFKIAITRPPTQTPVEQVESAFEVASQRAHEATEMASAAAAAIVADTEIKLATVLSRRSGREVVEQSVDALQAVRESVLAELDRSTTTFRESAEAILVGLPRAEQTSLRALIGRRMGQLQSVTGAARRSVNDIAMRIRRVLFDIRGESLKNSIELTLALKQIARILRHLDHPPQSAHISEIAKKLAALLDRILVALEGGGDRACVST
ncbi:MAG: hypothetical protein HYY93_05110 [Planctomycetes bacterium]|nr:hypothetical protein [Planctomycetota bacterium]